jgi:phage gp29-like protein
MPQLVGLAPQGNTGSLARAQEESDTLDMVLGGDSREVEDTLNEQLIRPLIDMNFGKMEAYPQFKFKPMREEDKNAFVEAWADAVSKGAATSTPETEAHTRGLLGFPEATEAEKKKMAEPKIPPSGAQPPKKGNEKGNGKDKVYVLSTLNAQEARKAWKEHVADLDGLEEDAKRELSDAFSDSILALAVDAKKKS